MKAVQLEGNEKVTIVDVPDPVPGPGEVLIAMRASGLCGSEMHSYRESGAAGGTCGHEGAGEVIALGDGVTRLAAGDRVGVSVVCGCGECAYCERGQYTWCRTQSFYGGMHAERLVAAERTCHKLPDDLDWGAGVLLTGDGLGVPYHTSTKLPAAGSDTVAIFGVGPIGLGNALLQSYLGRTVIAVDIAAPRLKIACDLGAAHTVNAGECDAVEKIKELTGGKGADICIEAAGRPQTARQCFAAVTTGGTVIFNGEQGPLELSPSDDFIRRDITAIGAWFYHFSEYAAMLALEQEGLDVGRMISHRFPFQKAEEAYREFAAGKTAKVMLEY